MLFDGLNLSDFKQKYSGSYGIKLPENIVTYIEDAHSDDGGVSYHIFTNQNGEKKQLVYNGENLKFPLPKSGLYNLNDSGNLVFVRRLADKQYKKGFGVGNYLLTCPFTYSLRQWNNLSPPLLVNFQVLYKMPYWKFANIQQIMFPKYYSWGQATLDVIEGDAIGRALTLTWAVVAPRTSEYKFEIYHGNFPVGFVSKNSSVVQILPIFEQEFKDYCVRNKLHVDVSTIK